MNRDLAYYNEVDPGAAEWLRELIRAGVIAPGIVDERSIVDVRSADLAGFTQCHFFAGIGVWSYALRLAGWPDDRPVWTGSCPCQPFSSAGGAAHSKMLAISGRTGRGSLASADLSASLASRLQAMTASLGSTLFVLTWKTRVTPSGRVIPALRASAHRTSGNGSTSSQLATLSAWPTARATDGTKGGPNQRGSKGDLMLPSAAMLASPWATPASRDWKDTAGMATTGTNPDGSLRTRLDQLPRQAAMASWATPNCADATRGSPETAEQKAARGQQGQSLIDQTPDPSTASGPTPNGSPAATAKRGQLNPALSRWLQALPAVWDSCGAMAMASVRNRQRRSSAPTSKPSTTDSSTTGSATP